MKGLLLKDFYELKNQFGLIIPLIGLYAIVTSFLDGHMAFSASYILVALITMLLAMLPTSSFAFDEWSGWDMYGLTINVTRKQIVDAKYVLILITAGVIFLADFAVFLLYGEDFWFSMMLSFLFAALTLPINGIMTPAIFKWGSEKGRMILMAMVVIPMLLTPLIPEDLNLTNWNPSLEFLIWCFIGMIFLFFGVIIISYFVSLHVYRKRDM
jgi:hypothetical protein